MQYPYQMLVLDIDGTLTTTQKEISPPTLSALLHLQERGYKLVLASGRPTAGMRPYATQLRLKEFGNYLLSFNGAKIIHCQTEQILYQRTLPQEVIPALYEAAIFHRTGIISYENDEIIAGTPIDTYMEREAHINKLPIRQVNDFSSYICFPVNKCLMTADPEHLEKVESVLKEQFHSLLNIYRSEPYFLEIMPQNVDKAHSLSKLLTSLGLTEDQMICCGDGFNDISMIECAGLGVAMENAQDIVKSAADYITSSNDENGIQKVVEKFFPA